MMQSCTRRVSSSRLFIVSCISLCLVVSIDSIASANDLIKSMCSSSYIPRECETVIRQDPRSKTATKPMEVANIITDLAIANATKCAESFTRLQNLATTPPAWKQALKNCAEEFEFSASNFQTAKELLTRNPKSASYHAFVAGDGAQGCDYALKHAHVNIPQVTAYGEYLGFFSGTVNNMYSNVN